MSRSVHFRSPYQISCRRHQPRIRFESAFPGCGAAGRTRQAINQRGCAPTDQPDRQAIVLALLRAKGAGTPGLPTGISTHARAERVEGVGEQLAHASGEGCWRL